MPAKSNNILLHGRRLKWLADDNTRPVGALGREADAQEREFESCGLKLLSGEGLSSFQFAYLWIEALMHIMRDLGKVSPPQTVLRSAARCSGREGPPQIGGTGRALMKKKRRTERLSNHESPNWLSMTMG